MQNNLPFTASDMADVVRAFESKTITLLTEKAKDYANDQERLLNFVQVAGVTGSTPEQVCLTYMMKHVQALGNMAKRGDYVWDWTKPDGSEGAKQRIADAINYLFILACIMEARERQKAK